MDSSLLARLSPELRNQIYECTFTSPYAVKLQSGSVQHALTKTCRQLRQETLDMYYALTRFNAHLDDGPATPLVRWLERLGPESIVLINEINVWDMHNLKFTLHGTESATRLLRRDSSPKGDQGAEQASTHATCYILKWTRLPLTPLDEQKHRDSIERADISQTLRNMGFETYCFLHGYADDTGNFRLCTPSRRTSEFTVVHKDQTRSRFIIDPCEWWRQVVKGQAVDYDYAIRQDRRDG